MADYPIHHIDADEALDMVCRKVCRYCSEGIPVCKRKGERNWMHKTGDDVFMGCAASEIQELRFTVGDNNARVEPESAMESVSLLPAVFWECPKCGQTNYQASQHREISQDDLTRMMRESGQLQEFESAPEGVRAVGRLVPKYVRCFRCGDWYLTANFMEAKDDDEKGETGDG